MKKSLKYWQRLIGSGLLVLAAAGCGKSTPSCPTSFDPNSALQCATEKAETVAERRTKNDPALPYSSRNPFENRFPYSRFNVEMIPFAHTMKELQRAFAFTRDTAFFPAGGTLPFERRMAFLYPDDGCWSRSYLTVAQAAELFGPDLPRFYQIYAFGDMGTPTNNAPPGKRNVYWNYHVVPLIRVGNEAWVIDVAVDPKAPMTLNTWMNRLAGENQKTISVAICDGFAYGMYQPCAAGRQIISLGGAMRDHLGFLQLEESRLRSLGRDPVRELAPGYIWW